MTATPDADTTAASTQATHEVVFTLPIGERGISYRHLDSGPGLDSSQDAENQPDLGSRPWGPSGFAVIQGLAGLEFIIGDSALQRVLQYSQTGELLAVSNLQDLVVSTDDLQVVGSELWVLDQAAAVPRVLRFAQPAQGEAGAAEALPQFRIDLVSDVQVLPVTEGNTGQGDAHPSTDELGGSIGEGLSGLAVDDQGVLIVYGNGSRLFRPTLAQVSPAGADAQLFEEVDGYTLQGQVYSTDPTADVQPDSDGQESAAGVTVNGRFIAVQGTDVRGIRFLGAGSDGEFYIVAEEVSDGETIQVDQTVRRYAADGTQTGIARIPLSESVAYVQNGLVLGPDGAVYALVAQRDAVSVQRLVFAAVLSPLPPAQAANFAVEPATETIEGDGFAPLADSPCVSRESMIAMGFHYRDNRATLSEANLNGHCPGRKRPRYLNNGPGEYGSVAYDWGGFDTVEQYNTFMAQGFQAGDIPDGLNDPPTPCSKGVDCSGFVSRCWGLKTKQGTSTIHNVSDPISISNLKPGDILNRAGRHVTLYHHEDADGVWAFESTTWGERDRVIFRPHPWSFYEGFKARRFKKVC